MSKNMQIKDSNEKEKKNDHRASMRKKTNLLSNITDKRKRKKEKITPMKQACTGWPVTFFQKLLPDYRRC